MTEIIDIHVKIHKNNKCNRYFERRKKEYVKIYILNYMLYLYTKKNKINYRII